MSESEKLPPSVTDSPWFWVMLFSLAALAALFTIGPKFERREAAIEENFHARERGLGREATENVPDKDGSAVIGAETPDSQSSVPPWQPIFTLTPIAVALAGIALVAMFNIMRFHRRRLDQLRQDGVVKH